ncbi:MAG: alpha/beta hydrolase [Thermoleophilaceae bacterium]|nr:alpha/beta hydrolase [Thermoleophilaceae bacterium]
MGSGPPLVLVNGYAATKDDWDPTFLDSLGSFASVLCPDNAGVGDSPATATLSVASMAEDVLALMDARGIASAPVAGWSMGGFVAQVMAARAPERVEALVLLSTDGGGPGAVRSTDEVAAALVDHGGTPRDRATRLLGLLFPPSLATGIDAQFGDVVAAARAALDPDVLTAQERAMDAWHAERSDGRLASIACPVLVAAGSEDVVIPPENAALLAAALPGASEPTVFEGGGHAFMAQEPARLAQLIEEFRYGVAPQT